MRSARPLVALSIALATGATGLAMGMFLGMRDTDPLYFLLTLFTWGLAGSVVGMAAGATVYAAFLRFRRNRDSVTEALTHLLRWPKDDICA
jgi:hypothetical protein